MGESNMYSAPSADIWSLFEGYVEGNPQAWGLALGAQPLPGAARDALEKSLDSFGYGQRALAWAAVGELDAHALFMLVEGLDPVCLVVCDNGAAAALEAAYRCTLPRDDHAHVFGRPAVVFTDFGGMLATDRDKQRAWRLLKTLPRRTR